jgi:hypothetical protein
VLSPTPQPPLPLPTWWERNKTPVWDQVPKAMPEDDPRQCGGLAAMSEMQRANACEKKRRRTNRVASTLVIAGAIIAAVRLAREENISRPFHTSQRSSPTAPAWRR